MNWRTDYVPQENDTKNNMNTTVKSPEMRRIFWDLRSPFLAIAAFCGFLNILMLSPSIYMMQVYDRVLNSRNQTTLWMLTLLLIGVYLFMTLLESVRAWVLVRTGAKMDARLNQHIFGASFRHSLADPGANASGPMHDLNLLRQALTGPALIALLDTPWLPLYLGVIAMLSWELAVFALVGAALLGIIAFITEITTASPINKAQQKNASAQNALVNSFRNAEVIESMGMLGAIRQRWLHLHQEHIELQAKASDLAALLSGMGKFVRMSMQSLALGFGALLVLEGRMSPGSMIAASILVSRALSPVEQLVTQWKQIVTARDAYARLRALLERHPAAPEVLPLEAPTGNIRLDGVSVVAPGGEKNILRNLQFDVPKGRCVAVIGPSGSGKSTLAKLLVGVWPASTGTVRLDGANILQRDKEHLGPSIGYLPQDIELFDGTVAENIARFGPLQSIEIVAAAKKVGMHEVILSFPNGYDTKIGVGGNALSGGQRQRIALARALYGNPSMLVLDEPNSNLDELGEQALYTCIHNLHAQGTTVILITHKMASLAVVDSVMVLAEGLLKAYGPRDKVLLALKQHAEKMPNASTSLEIMQTPFQKAQS